MIDHVIMMRVLGTAQYYVHGFWACFAIMAFTSQLERKIRPAQSGEWARGATIFLAKLGFMMGEYGLFIYFLNGSKLSTFPVEFVLPCF